MATKMEQYYKQLRTSFTKLAKLEFLNHDGTIAFVLDNNPRNKRSRAFLQSGQLTVNQQNGSRRTATVTLANLNGDYEFSADKIWFGQQIRLMEGLMLPDGTEFYLPQGVFYIKDPEEKLMPGMKTVTYNLVDKWSYLDGTLHGYLDGTYEIPLNTNIFTAIKSILDMNRGNGYPVDSVPPLFTEYYNERTTTLPDGTVISDLLLPYVYRNDAENGSYADVVLEMGGILSAWVGYDATGRLRIEPGNDDILDITKPIEWEFRPNETEFLGATYTTKNTEVFNDLIIVGGSLTEYGYTAARAENNNPRSDTSIGRIGRKTKKEMHNELYSESLCQNLALFKMKRQSILQKSVTIQCQQMFHINENQLVTIARPDKENSPIERHLVTGFTRPIAQNGAMQIQATSVSDLYDVELVMDGLPSTAAGIRAGATWTGWAKEAYATATNNEQ